MGKTSRVKSKTTVNANADRPVAVKSLADRFWNWLDERHITHRVMIYFTLWLTLYTMHKAWEFAYTAQAGDGINIAAIIAAITAPVTALQGWVFQTYSSRRKFIHPTRTTDDEPAVY